MASSSYTLFSQWLEILKKAPTCSFFLPELLRWMEEYSQTSGGERVNWQEFEFWLNHFAGLGYEEERLIRGKIVGHYLPREEYQTFFPVGMGQKFQGSHFVVAHLSPDLDTTIASFLCWMEAVACKVGSKQHLWSLPGGLSDLSAVNYFCRQAGGKVFDLIPRKEGALSLSARDLLTRQGFETFTASASTPKLQHDREQKALVYVDEEGRFKGDWRLQDSESVGQITLLFKTLLKSFETDFVVYYLKLLGENGVSDNIWQRPLDLSPFDDKQRELLNLFLTKIVGLDKGLKGSFEAVFKALNLKIPSFKKDLEPFKALEEMVLALESELTCAREWCDRLGTAIEIKEKLCGKSPHRLELSSDLEEIRFQMKDYDSLTVVDAAHKPIGIVRAKDLRAPSLGAVSFCDFSNFDEVRLPPYLSPISVIDHHKSTFSSPAVATVSVADVQSCNILLAEKLFTLYDRYKTEASSPYFIHPERERLNWRLALWAILDDTDFLTKVSRRDVLCIDEILSRLRKLEGDKSPPKNPLNHLAPDEHFAAKGALLLLEDPLLKSIKNDIMHQKETELEESLQHLDKSLFSDTKEQNGSCLITQIKRFEANKSRFMEVKERLIGAWLEFVEEAYRRNPQIDLAILMLSSITFSEGDRDELIFWHAPTEKGKSDLSLFLQAFYPTLNSPTAYFELYEPTGHELEELFLRGIDSKELVLKKKRAGSLKTPYAVLNYPAGELNSRKSRISPYLPKRS